VNKYLYKSKDTSVILQTMLVKMSQSYYFETYVPFLTEVSKENLLIMQTCLNSFPRGVEPRSAGATQGPFANICSFLYTKL
jgi:hypothetical protein